MRQGVLDLGGEAGEAGAAGPTVLEFLRCWPSWGQNRRLALTRSALITRRRHSTSEGAAAGGDGGRPGLLGLAIVGSEATVGGGSDDSHGVTAALVLRFTIVVVEEHLDQGDDNLVRIAELFGPAADFRQAAVSWAGLRDNWVARTAAGRPRVLPWPGWTPAGTVTGPVECLRWHSILGCSHRLKCFFGQSAVVSFPFALCNQCRRE